MDQMPPVTLDTNFPVKASELTLQFTYPPGKQAFSFKNNSEPLEVWQRRCKDKLVELLNCHVPAPCTVRELRQTQFGGVAIKALVMRVSEALSIPAYLLLPEKDRHPSMGVMAIHGHGEVEASIGGGDREDYHHRFALKVAQQGRTVLCPELRGFGALSNLAQDLPGGRLDYWPKGYRQFTLATDGFQKGRTLMGDTIEDLLRWEEWLVRTLSVSAVQAAGISWGGDLALSYPVFSTRVGSIFASGTLGSFAPVFARCYNAPAHCIPRILDWMDRADIAGLNAPRPLALHYGALDVPGPKNASAAYNETVSHSVAELKAIYKAARVEDNVSLVVSEGRKHEMDNDALLAFLEANAGS